MLLLPDFDCALQASVGASGQSLLPTPERTGGIADSSPPPSPISRQSLSPLSLPLLQRAEAVAPCRARAAGRGRLSGGGGGGVTTWPAPLSCAAGRTRRRASRCCRPPAPRAPGGTSGTIPDLRGDVQVRSGHRAERQVRHRTCGKTRTGQVRSPGGTSGTTPDLRGDVQVRSGHRSERQV